MSAKLDDGEMQNAAEIVATFAGLIHAWKTNDFHKAAESSNELKRLGVIVKIPGRHKPRRPAAQR